MVLCIFASFSISARFSNSNMIEFVTNNQRHIVSFILLYSIYAYHFVRVEEDQPSPAHVVIQLHNGMDQIGTISEATQGYKRFPGQNLIDPACNSQNIFGKVYSNIFNLLNENLFFQDIAFLRLMKEML